MRIIIAARLSQTSDGQTGIETQDDETRKRFEAEGHTIVAVVADYASGTVQPWNRKNLKQWVTDPERIKLYDAIAGYRFDRLSRGDKQSTNEIETWAYKHKKQLLTEDGLAFPSEGTEGIRWDITARISREEWLKTSERYRRMQKWLREGGYLVGKAPYGYMIVSVPGSGKTPKDDHKRLEPDPVAKLIVQEAARRYLDGATLRAICDDFNERGILSPNGGRWIHQTLSDILRNPAIAGRRMDKDGKTVLRMEPLISYTDFRRIGARMDKRAQRKGRANSGAFTLLTGVIYCPDGQPMYRINSKYADGPRPFYYCRMCPKGKREMLPMELTNKLAEAKIRAALIESPDIEKRESVKANGRQDAIEQKRQDIRELDSTAGDFLERVTAMHAEIKRLESLPEEPEQIITTVISGQKLADDWPALSEAGKRAALLSAGVRVVAWRDEAGDIHIEPMIPGN